MLISSSHSLTPVSPLVNPYKLQGLKFQFIGNLP